MAISTNLDRALSTLPREARRAIIDEISRMNNTINNLEMRNRRLTDSQAIQVRDIAKKEAQFQGSGTVKTWDIRNLIRAEEPKTYAVDIAIQTGGELVILHGREVIIGN